MWKRADSRRVWSVGVLALSLGCHVAAPASHPGTDDLARPHTRAGARALLESARRHLAVGLEAEARVALAAAVAADPADLRAAREWQGLRLAMGEFAAVLAEARAGVVQHGRARDHYLLGRLLGEPDAQRAAFRAALARDPGFFWAHFGLAVTDLRARRLAEGQAHLRAARRAAGPAERAVVLALEARLLVQGWTGTRPETVTAALDAWADAAPGEAAPYALRARWRARVATDAQGMAEAFAAARRGLAVDRHDPAAASVLADLLRTHGTPVEAARALVAARTAMAAGARSPALWRCLGLAAQGGGDLDGAAEAYAQACRDATWRIECLADLRLLHVRRRDPLAALRVEDGLAPRDVTTAPENAVRARYVALYAAGEAWAAAGPTAAWERLRFAEAAAAVGWLDEAEHVVRVLRLERPDVPGVAAAAWHLESELKRHARLVRGLRELLEAGYRDAEGGGTPPDLAALLRDIRDCSLDEVGEDLSAGVQVVRYAWLGELLDPRPAHAGALQRHFLRFNHHLMLGRRNGAPVEAALLRIVDLRPDAKRRLWGTAVTCDVLRGEARDLRSYREHQGGEIAGAAFRDGFYVELGAVRRTEAQALAVAALPPDRRARLRTLVAPLSRDAGGALTGADDPGLRLALVLRAATDARGRPDGALAQGLSMDELIAVEAHELAHVLDARRLLPMGTHWLGVMRELALAGWSAAAVEARLEEHAGWASLAHAPAPHAVLAHFLGFAPEADSAPPHSVAYLGILRTLVRHLAAHRPEYPTLDPARTILHQLPRLTPDELRRAARACAVARGFAPAE